MIKILITESQYKSILIYENNKSKQIIEEGPKDWALGIALFASLFTSQLSGQNAKTKKDAVDAVSTKPEAATWAYNIAQTIENNKEFLGKLDDVLKKEGFGGLKGEDAIKDNADKVAKTLQFAAAGKFDEPTEKKGKEYYKGFKLDTVRLPEMNANELAIKIAKYMASGQYALAGLDLKQDVKKIKGDTIGGRKIIFNEANIQVPTENLFETAKYTLNPSAAQDILNQIDSLKNKGYIIDKVIIESSTDKERMVWGKDVELDKDDVTGNKKLAQERANAVRGLIGDNVGNATIDVTIKPDQGETTMEEFRKQSEIIRSKNSTQDQKNTAKQELKKLRDTEKLNRYVDIKILYHTQIDEPMVITPDKYEIIGEKGSCTLIRVSVKKNKPKKGGVFFFGGESFFGVQGINAACGY
jgi:outer membrane protein OmpA-like peptidoglycan-associated protein